MKLISLPMRLGPTVAAFVLMPLLGGCSGLPAAGCVPRLTIEPAVAQPGSVIVVNSDTTCGDRVPDGGWIVTATSGDDDRHVSIITTDSFNGSFSVDLSLPQDFPAGEATVRIENWDYSFCSGSGSGSCASASGDFMVATSE
jgi:hypothetical protein